jgi:hypothetical protein
MGLPLAESTNGGSQCRQNSGPECGERDAVGRAWDHCTRTLGEYADGHWRSASEVRSFHDKGQDADT